jgi:hypothetical protein
MPLVGQQQAALDKRLVEEHGIEPKSTLTTPAGKCRNLIRVTESQYIPFPILARKSNPAVLP